MVSQLPPRPLKPVSRSCLQFKGLDAHDLASAYLRHAKQRFPNLQVDDVLSGSRIEGPGWCWLLRRVGNELRIHGRIEQALGTAVHYSLAVQDRGGHAVLEHVQVHEGEDSPSAADAVLPSFFRELIEAFADRAIPPDLAEGTAVEVPEEDVSDIVELLLDPERAYPIVFVTPLNRTGETWLDPDLLAQALVGIAEVHVLERPEACWRLREELLARGASDKLGCFDGALRLYRPGFHAAADLQDHPLFLRHVFASLPPAERVPRFAHRLAGLLADDVDTLRVVRAIEAPAPPPPPAPAAVSHSEIERLRAQVRLLEVERSELQQLLQTADDDYREAKSSGLQARRALERAELDRDRAQAELSSAWELGTVADALQAAMRLFSDRIVVFSGVEKSAEGSLYHRPAEAFRVLNILAMAEDDGEVQRLLGRFFTRNQARWRGTDSPQTIRAFPRLFNGPDGQQSTSTRHITLGGSERADRHMQIYYDWLPGGRVGLLHLGQHLLTVAVDT